MLVASFPVPPEKVCLALMQKATVHHDLVHDSERRRRLHVLVHEMMWISLPVQRLLSKSPIPFLLNGTRTKTTIQVFFNQKKRLFFSQCLKFTQKVLSTYKILQRSRRHSTFRPFCFWLAMPKFTHSTADFYQNSPQIFTKHGRFSSFWKGNYQTLCFLFRRQKCWTFFMTRRRLSRLFERES